MAGVLSKQKGGGQTRVPVAGLHRSTESRASRPTSQLPSVAGPGPYGSWMPEDTFATGRSGQAPSVS